MELEDPKDLRARFRKFLFLTNERKKMSKTTLRKRISLVAVTALTAGVLSVVAAPVANANIATQALVLPAAGEMKVATGANVTGATVTQPIAGALSLGLIYKDPTTGTAQTATVIAGGALVLMTNQAVATAQAFTATGGTFSTPIGGPAGATAITGSDLEYGLGSASILVKGTNATNVAVRWQAPTTPGTYTVTGTRGTDSTFTSLATIANGTVFGNIVVTVVASAAADTPALAFSSCVTDTASGAQTSTADSTGTVTNSGSWYVKWALNNAYQSPVATSGNIVATVSGDANISIGNGAQAAGTGKTVVAFGTGAAGSDFDALRITQATAGAPVTATVTITFNGVTVCTKTVSISGVAASITVSDVATVDLGGSVTNQNWLSDPTGIGTGGSRAGHYYITLKDTAGNIVTPASSGEFSMDPTTTTTIVTALAVNSNVATSTSSTSSFSKSVGTFTCGPVAGSSAVKLRHTSAATGVTITSPAFTARCADDPYTYTVSFDKASYTQGEIATMSVQFLDSKGNKANSVDAPGAVSMILPFMTLVTSTGSATALPKADGVMTYTMTVGTSVGLTPGTYTGVVDFSALTDVAAVKATPTYKIVTGGDTTTNADVLKSIVALIASINKQIQALQKLILRR